MTSNKHEPFENIAAGAEWVDRLLDLFWAVDATARDEGIGSARWDLPEAIRDAYDAAEKARREL